VWQSEQRLFQRAQRVDVEIVGGLIEEQEIAAALEQLGQVEAIAFATGEDPHLLLLIRAAEVEARRVGPGIHAPLAKL
jgi:hypothetical protein